ncbi:hypothetical protein CASFOL_010053 [Castilleja foliolosa]|uniref:Time for coffee n=1 Tax=Castilleja foliolosa TaxID=1961234 RepID=A0ABD3DRF4_9LAMI
MDKNRDLRRTAMSTVNGLQRRRQRDTTPRDSTDGDRQMELKETVRLRDREQLQKRERDRDFSKRRRIDKRNTDSSDGEYFEEENDTRIHQQNRTNQLIPAFFSPTNNRRDLRAHRSSPMLRTSIDEVIGVPIPRRARSVSAKKLHDYRNSGNGGFGDDLSHRRSTPSPATVSPIGSGSLSPSSSGASLKKKMKYIEPRTRVLGGASNSKPSSVIQDDIEIEVAEALFDLMTQSHFQSQSSEREDKVDRDSTKSADDVVKRFKAAPGKDENGAFKVQNEQVIKVNADTILAEKQKYTDEPAQELESRDGFVDREKVGFSKESESSSCIKVAACGIQDPTVTKADCAASVVEAKEGSRIEIDLMALPSMPSSSEREALHDIDPKVLTPDVQKKSEMIGAISGNQSLNLNLEKEPKIWKEQKSQSPTPSLPFPIGMASWPGVVPHPGFMPSHRTVLPIDGNARSSMTVQTPQFKFTQPQTKRSTIHRCIADNIHHHQQLVMKSLSSGHTGTATTLFGTKPLSLKSTLPTQRHVLGRDKSSDVAADFNATTSGKPKLQQDLNQGLAHNNFMHYQGFTFPLGHHQTTMMAPANLSGPLPPQSASSISNPLLPSNNPSRKLTPNSSLPDASSSSFNHHPFFPSKEAAASYLAMLQNAGCSFPIPTNMFTNSSFYSSPAFNISQKSASHNKLSSPQPEKNGASNINNSKGQAYSFSVQPMNFAAVSPITNNKKHGDLSQQGSKNRAELVPRPFPLSQNPASIFQMLPEYSWNGQNNTNKNFPMSEGTKSHASSGSKPDTSAQALGFLPSSSLSSVAIPNFYHQMQLKGASGVQTDYSSFLPKWDNSNNSNFLKNTTATPEGSSSSQSLVNIPQLKTNHHVTYGNNNPALIVGSSSSSRNTSSEQRNAVSMVLVSASQEKEGSQNGLGQKASPACRRVLPSILSTSASQLSEIKYG